MRRNSLVKPLLVLVVALVAREYARATFFTPDMAAGIVYSLNDRPYVYRALVPWLAWSLTRLGIAPETALTLVIMCMAIGFLYALYYLLRSFKRS